MANTNTIAEWVMLGNYHCSCGCTNRAATDVSWSKSAATPTVTERG